MGEARRSGLLVCGLLSALAHAGLLGGWGEPGGPRRTFESRPGPRAVELRAPDPLPVRPPEPAVAEPLVLADASPTLAQIQAMSPLAPLAPLDVPAAEPLAGVPQEIRPSEALRMPAAPAERFNDDAYVPRPMLSVVPAAQQPLILDWPAEGAPPAGRYQGVVSLFIDEQGVIQRIRFDDEGLPAALQDQARQAFATVRYSPGKVKDQIVKSRIRLELSFEADPRMVVRGNRR